MNKKRTIHLSITLIVIFVLIFFVSPVSAQETDPGMSGMQEVQTATNYSDAGLPTIIGRTLKLILSFLGLIALIIVVYGGIIWMTAGGNPEKISKAKKIMISGLIGVLIIAFSYAIASFIISKLGGVAGEGGTTGTGGDDGTVIDEDREYYSRLRVENIQPQGELTIRNVVVNILFNQAVKQSSLYQDSIAVYPSDSDEPVAGQLSFVNSREIKFVPEAVCPEPHQDLHCFDANQSYQVEVVAAGTDHSLVSQDNQSLQCVVSYLNDGVKEINLFYFLTSTKARAAELAWISPPPTLRPIINPIINPGLISTDCCQASFTTGEFIDTEDPTVEIAGVDPSQLSGGIYYVPENSLISINAIAQDDSGVSSIALYNRQEGDNYDFESLPHSYILPIEGDSSRQLSGSFIIDTPILAEISVINSYYLAQTVDSADHYASSNEVELALLPAHCFNDTQDADEEGEDCGGADCLSCVDLSADDLSCAGKIGSEEPQQTCGTDGICCNELCCVGRCAQIDERWLCLTDCGNDIIDGAEQCDGENLAEQSCEDLQYTGGDLSCNPDCTFNVSQCLGRAVSGGVGDLCRSEITYCQSGTGDCQPENIYSCLSNNIEQNCRCCCDPNAGEDTCAINGLECRSDQSPCSGDNRGLCCGCLDDQQCNQGIGQLCDSADQCCHNFPLPTGLDITGQNSRQIAIKWNYSADDWQYVDSFEIWRAGPIDLDADPLTDVDYSKIDDVNASETCELNTIQNEYTCDYVDGGSFVIDKKYFYKVQAKHGTHTAYSGFSDPDDEKITGELGCAVNTDCSSGNPCCAQISDGSKQCLPIDLCTFWGAGLGYPYCLAGDLNDTTDYCQPAQKKSAQADFTVNNEQLGACLISLTPNVGGWGALFSASGWRFGTTQGLVTFFNSLDQMDANLSGATWSDSKIDNIIVPFNSVSGEVKVKPAGISGYSNAVNFEVKQTIGGAGDDCLTQGSSICIFGSSSCTTGYNCLPYSDNCRCCCDPTLAGTDQDTCLSINSKLNCTADIYPCDSQERGLCCGCNTDNDCGDGIVNGCGLDDQQPAHCCYPRPTVENIGAQSCLNTVPYAEFDQLMNKRTINTDNVKLYKIATEEEIIGKLDVFDVNRSETCTLTDVCGQENGCVCVDGSASCFVNMEEDSCAYLVPDHTEINF
ncbi:MAG: TrbC/VirB2 family protein, partial [Candidatus Aenigmarchaeota archaeon]|nr:TrbC/VirB2 family protein [Candidatus Aenigmarchaeota archaeon]